MTPEFGYALSTNFPLNLKPQGRDDPRPVASTDLGGIALRGSFFRITADLSF